jgi:tetratricopeptide (TPR) repeat protein
LLRDAEGLPAALAWFGDAVKRAPDDVGLLGEYAATLGEAGRNRDMLQAARKMVELDPGHPRAYFLQALLAARAGLDDLARRLLWRTGGAYDGTPAGQLLTGVLDLRTGNAAQAVDRFDALAARQPDNALAAQLLGRALLANGEGDEVIARLGPAADRTDASPYLLTLVGRAYEMIGRRDAAARYLDRAAGPAAVRLDVLPVGRGGETGAAATIPSIRALLAQGRRGEALAAAGQVERMYPGSADLAFLAGDVALLAGDPSAAVEYYRRSAAVRGSFALIERQALALRMTGRDRAAEALLAGYLAENPRSTATSAMLGRILAERGRWREATPLLEWAGRLGGGRDPRLLADLAAARLMLGNAEAANEAARRAYAQQRGNGRIAAVLARVLQAGAEPSPGADALLAKARLLGEPSVLALR